jgi:hypothetical protein
MTLKLEKLNLLLWPADNEAVTLIVREVAGYPRNENKKFILKANEADEVNKHPY